MNPFDYAIAQLKVALETAENNAPINEREGKIEQAKLERECAESYRAAIEKLERAM